jgi:hypothetical protein
MRNESHSSKTGLTGKQEADSGGRGCKAHSRTPTYEGQTSIFKVELHLQTENGVPAVCFRHLRC